MTDNMTSNTRACPFCGNTASKPMQLQNNGAVYWAVVCGMCAAEGPAMQDLDSAVGVWQLRATHETSAPQDAPMAYINHPPPHCPYCQCEEAEKGMVERSDYLDFHRALLDVKYQAKTLEEAQAFASRGLQHEETECSHTMLADRSTLRVIDPYKAQCRVCYEFFDLPLHQNG